MQDAQKGQTSHPPNPGCYFTLPPRVCQDRLFALGRALSQARLQRATKDGSSKLACVRSPLMVRMSPPLRALSAAFQFSLPLFRGVAKAALYCAHRTSTVSSCAFCEQEGHLAAPSPAGGLFQHPASSTACQRPMVSRTIVPFSPLAQPCVPSGNERPNSETFAIAPCSIQVKPLSVVR